MLLQKGSLLTTLPSIEKEYSLSFELTVIKHTSGDWRNVLHLTTGGDLGVLGYQIPSVWVYEDDKLNIFSPINGNGIDKYYHISVSIRINT